MKALGVIFSRVMDGRLVMSVFSFCDGNSELVLLLLNHRRSTIAPIQRTVFGVRSVDRLSFVPRLS